VAGTEVPAIRTATLVIEAMNVAGFLASRRKKVVLLLVPPLAEVEKFIANEPVLAVPVAVAKVADDKPLRVPEGSIPILSQPLGSKMAHSRENRHDVGGFGGDSRRQYGSIPQSSGGVLGKTLSPIPETGNSSRAPTPKRPRSPTPARVKKEMELRRSQAS
jgi:hypothetical protein